MKELRLNASQMIKIQKEAFKKDQSTKLVSELVKQPTRLVNALEKTSVRFSLVQPKRRIIRVG